MNRAGDRFFGRFRSQSLRGLAFLVVLLASSCAGGRESDLPIHPVPSTTLQLLDAERLDTIALDREAYFVGTNGKSTAVEAGTYQIEVIELTALRLVHQKGGGSVTIRATPTRHEDLVESAIALSVSDPEDRVHVVMLLPGGKALDAAGSYQMIRSRGIAPLVLSPERLHEAVLEKLTEMKRR